MSVVFSVLAVMAYGEPTTFSPGLRVRLASDDATFAVSLISVWLLFQSVTVVFTTPATLTGMPARAGSSAPYVLDWLLIVAVSVAWLIGRCGAWPRPRGVVLKSALGAVNVPAVTL